MRSSSKHDEKNARLQERINAARRRHSNVNNNHHHRKSGVSASSSSSTGCTSMIAGVPAGAARKENIGLRNNQQQDVKDKSRRSPPPAAVAVPSATTTTITPRPVLEKVASNSIFNKNRGYHASALVKKDSDDHDDDNDSVSSFDGAFDVGGGGGEGNCNDHDHYGLVERPRECSESSFLEANDDIDDNDSNCGSSIFTRRGDKDLRHVDQSVNLMDAEAGNYSRGERSPPRPTKKKKPSTTPRKSRILDYMFAGSKRNTATSKKSSPSSIMMATTKNKNNNNANATTILPSSIKLGWKGRNNNHPSKSANDSTTSTSSPSSPRNSVVSSMMTKAAATDLRRTAAWPIINNSIATTTYGGAAAAAAATIQETEKRGVSASASSNNPIIHEIDVDAAAASESYHHSWENTATVHHSTTRGRHDDNDHIDNSYYSNEVDVDDFEQSIDVDDFEAAALVNSFSSGGGSGHSVDDHHHAGGRTTTTKDAIAAEETAPENSNEEMLQTGSTRNQLLDLAANPVEQEKPEMESAQTHSWDLFGAAAAALMNSFSSSSGSSVDAGGTKDIEEETTLENAEDATPEDGTAEALTGSTRNQSANNPVQQADPESESGRSHSSWDPFEASAAAHVHVHIGVAAGVEKTEKSTPAAEDRKEVATTGPTPTRNPLLFVANPAAQADLEERSCQSHFVDPFEAPPPPHIYSRKEGLENAEMSKRQETEKVIPPTGQTTMNPLRFVARPVAEDHHPEGSSQAPFAMDPQGLDLESWRKAGEGIPGDIDEIPLEDTTMKNQLLVVGNPVVEQDDPEIESGQGAVSLVMDPRKLAQDILRKVEELIPSEDTEEMTPEDTMRNQLLGVENPEEWEDEIESDRLAGKRFFPRKRTKCWRYGVGCGCLAIFFGIVVSLLGSSSSSNGVTNSPTFTPSLPTPTSVPTTIMDYSLLPSYTIDAIFNNSSSPQSEAYRWLQDHPNLHQFSDKTKVQLIGLATFYYALDGPNWNPIVRQGWMNYEHEECHWFSDQFVQDDVLDKWYSGCGEGATQPIDGTDDETIDCAFTDWFNNTCHKFWKTNESSICDSSGNYQHLGLVGACGLNGNNVPPEISLLESLQGFQVTDSSVNMSLAGMIPTTFSQLPNLTRIDFHNNDLFGPLPDNLWDLTGLKYLDLSVNQAVKGTIPSSLGQLSELSDLDLRRTQLYGQLPSEIGLLTQLTRLELEANKFWGELPTQIGLLTELEILTLSWNAFHGTIPSQIGKLSNLKKLWLNNNNQLLGPLPSELGRLSKLRMLHAAFTKISGTIPSEVGSMKDLLSVHLGSTHLSGTIPIEIAQLSNLEYFGLIGTKVSTTIPPELCMMVLFDILDPHCWGACNCNSAPEEIGLQTSLETLSLEGKDLVGTLPTSIGLLTDLSYLSLANNALTGNIPSQLGRLTALTYLSLAQNAFSGVLPEEVCILLNSNHNLNQSMMSMIDCSNHLCGCDNWCPCNNSTTNSAP